MQIKNFSQKLNDEKFNRKVKQIFELYKNFKREKS